MSTLHRRPIAPAAPRPRRTHPAPALLAGAASLALIAASGCAGGKASVADPAAPAHQNGTAAAAPAAAAEPAARGYTAVIDGAPVPAPALEMGDPATVRRILDTGLNDNRVMDHLTYLCTKIGPRLTGSANAEAAARWAAAQFESWGLQNVHLHEWGTIPVRFDRGPSTGKFVTEVERRNDDGTTRTEDRVVREPEFTTRAWAAGTDGPRRGPVVRLPQTDEEFATIVDKYPGAWVLVPPAPPRATGQQGIRGSGAVAGNRYSERIKLREQVAKGELDPATLPPEQRILFTNISGFISTSRDERVWTGSVPGWRELDPANIPQDVEVTVRLSDYDYLNSRVSDGEAIFAEFDLRNTFTPGPIPCYNVVAEIPGTARPEEVVIISAHLDSWNGVGSMGTTDNGTGSSVTLEAARLLMAAGARPERTIRFILWSGEEQGLLGSKAYVESIKSELEHISAVFVDDGGTNYEGGLHCTRDMADMLAAATSPVNNLFFDAVDGKPLNVDIQPHDEWQQSGGSDHMSFIAEKVPAFFWVESGRADYGFGWHTQNDRLDLAIPEYLRQSATCAAVTSYNLACADTLLPRESVKPPERRQRRSEGQQNAQGTPATGQTPSGSAPATPPAPPPASPAPSPSPDRPAGQNSAGQGGN